MPMNLCLMLVLVGCFARAEQTDDWLVSWTPDQPTLMEGTLDGVPTLTLTNGLISRTFLLPRSGGFATVALNRHGHAGVEARGSMQVLRGPSPESEMVVDGVTYPVGGLEGQTDYAFMNTSLLHTLSTPENAFVYRSHRTTSPAPRYPWTPGERYSDNSSWPPLGLTLEVLFGPPPSASPAHQALVVTVVYEIYSGIPVLAKWSQLANPSTTTVTLNALTTELLHLTNEALGYWPAVTNGAITAGSVTGRVHMQSEFSRGGDTTSLQPDSRCGTCVQGNGLLSLNSSYPLGPAAQIGVAGFHGSQFTSYYTYLLLHDTDDRERQGLAVRKMYRTLAPQVTENPVFMHLTNTSGPGVRAAVDQCKLVGFEMIIMSFGSGLDMESSDPAYISQVAESVSYAHSQGIEIGGYNLMSSSRTVGGGGDCLGPDGKPDGASCLASSWSDGYFSRIQNFITKTGFDMIETDGPYEGAKCSNASHAHHSSTADSQWTQYERNMDFYAWARQRGMYIHAPDPYYMRGINKDGMGYVETNWNLPLWEQISLARQNMYDGTFSKVPSQGWMFVPIVQYHGGWPECCIEPAGFMGGQWEFYLAMYFGMGVSPCYRGYRLFDPAVPASRALVQKWTAANRAYRTVLHADLIHLMRSDGNQLDAVLHVQPNPAQSRERGLLVVFNQHPLNTVNTTIRVPLYYTGLSSVANVTKGPATGVDTGSWSRVMELARDWSIELPVLMPPHTVQWFVIS